MYCNLKHKPLVQRQATVFSRWTIQTLETGNWPYPWTLHMASWCLCRAMSWTSSFCSARSLLPLPSKGVPWKPLTYYPADALTATCPLVVVAFWTYLHSSLVLIPHQSLLLPSNSIQYIWDACTLEMCFFSIIKWDITLGWVHRCISWNKGNAPHQCCCCRDKFTVLRCCFQVSK